MKANAGLYTLEEVKEKGIKHEQPPEITCPYCNEPLEPIGVITHDGVLRWVTSQSCDCEASIAAQKAEEAKKEEAATQAAFDRCKRAGITRRYLDAQITTPEALSYIKGFADAQGRGLYLLGGVGAGKTYEASAIAKSFIWSGYSAVFTTTLGMLDAIKKSYDNPTAEGVERFCGVDILILDDFGKENANSWVLTTIFQVINSRYEDMRPTIFTSQYAPDALERRLARNYETESAKAIVSRIVQTSDVVVLRHGDRRRNG